MEHLAAILLLVTCTDDLGSCREVPAEVPFYQSAADCEADLEPALVRLIRTDPQAFGQCVAVDPADEGNATLTWEIKEGGVFHAKLEYTDVMIASVTGKNRR